jgi:hypothetical protein
MGDLVEVQGQGRIPARCGHPAEPRHKGDLQEPTGPASSVQGECCQSHRLASK